MAACGELEIEIEIATSELGIEIANLRARRVLRRLRVCAGGWARDVHSGARRGARHLPFEGRPLVRHRRGRAAASAATTSAAATRAASATAASAAAACAASASAAAASAA